MTIFASDNVTAACPEVIQAINNANNGNVDSYGDDQWTNNLERKFSELFNFGSNGVLNKFFLVLTPKLIE